MQADSLPAEPQEKPKNTGVGSLSFLQRIFLTQELNPGLLHCRQILYQLSYQGIPYKNLLQQHSLKATVLRHSAFFMVQLSHLYMTTGKTIALTRWTFVDKVMSLFFNILSRLVEAFFPRNKRFLISSQESPSAVILEPNKIKSLIVSMFPHLFAMK